MLNAQGVRHNSVDRPMAYTPPLGNESNRSSMTVPRAAGGLFACAVGSTMGCAVGSTMGCAIGAAGCTIAVAGGGAAAPLVRSAYQSAALTPIATAAVAPP